MIAYLPKPYPGEILNSVIARALIRTGIHKAGPTITQIFGRMVKKPCVDLPSSIRALADRTRFVWGMNGDDIVNKLTLFPYYSHYVPQHRVKECFEAMLGDDGRAISVKLGINASLIKVPQYLRYCRACRDSDLLKYGETYWHRNHQLAGVLVCAEHGEPLLDTKALMRPAGAWDYIDATECTATVIAPAAIKLSDKELILAHKIALRCQEMLTGTVSRWKAENIPLSYRWSAFERGLAARSTSSLDQPRIERAMIELFGNELLKKMNCEIDPCRENNWVRLIMRPNAKARHPVQHAIMQIFMESTPIDTSRKLAFGYGPWACVNPLARHEEKYPVDKIEVRIGENGDVIAIADCSCGYRISSERTSLTDDHLPVVKKRLKLGPLWKEKVRSLKHEGLSDYAVSRKLHVASCQIKALLNDKASSRKLHPKCSKVDRPSMYRIQKWRKQMTALLADIVNPTKSMAVKKDLTLYKNLLENDQTWLNSVLVSKKTDTFNKVRVDWTKRDEEWSANLRKAADVIRSIVPIKQVSKTAMINEAGLKSGMTLNLNRLPKCKLALDACSESLEKYNERRLRDQAAHILESGKRVTPNRLRRKTGISGSSLSPHLNALIEFLSSDCEA